MFPWTKWYLQDEATGTPEGGGGGELNIAEAADSIGADLGLEEPGEGTDNLDDGSATPPAPKKDEPSPPPAAGQPPKPGDQPPATPPAPKAAPKAWKPEMHEAYTKLPPEVQAYIDQREAEVEEGFKQYGEHSRYAKSVRDVMSRYDALLTAQGVTDHSKAITAVMNAHYVLSTAQPEQKAAFMAGLAKNYGVDLQAALQAAQAGAPADETPAQREMRERLERIERAQTAEKNAQFEAIKVEAAKEVEAFASDPAHPFFNEVAHEVYLFLQDPNISLKDAYDRAVFANPVTRAKELARVKDEAEKEARKAAEEAAAKAEKARGTRIRGREEHRPSSDPLGSMDDTMRETLKDIKNRT